MLRRHVGTALRRGENLSDLGRQLLEAAEASTRTDRQLRDDNGDAANRECADAWQRCEDVVAEIARHPAKGSSGLRLKALAIDWTASDTRDALSDSIIRDLAAMESGIEKPVANRQELESALMDASKFGELTYLALCHLGFEKREPPKLSEDESSLVYWSINELTWKIDQAKAAFYGEETST